MTGIPQFWHFRIFQEQIVKLWKEIASRYKEEPFLLGYDLLNEPFLMPKKEGLLNAFLEEVTTAVREVDPNHIIFIEGDFFSMDFTDIRLPRDEQTALTFHFYPTVWDENLTNKDYDAAERVRKMDEQISGFAALRDTFGRPALCGEAGVDIKKDVLPFTMQLLDETLSLFQKHSLSWTLWSYKDAQWMGLAYPGNDTGWMKLVSEIRKKWSHYGQMQIADEFMDEIGKRYTDDFSKELKYELQFQLRGVLYRMEEEYILKPVLEKYSREEIMAMPESFRFENCDYYEEYRELLKQYSWK
jgi:aryl-phospho-beta-D-glucosidase BglC (GH1 family)